jgi:hypothetical protein
MSGADEATEVAADGIYATCGICFAIVAHESGHTAWHLSRGEVVSDGE